MQTKHDTGSVLGWHRPVAKPCVSALRENGPAGFACDAENIGGLFSCGGKDDTFCPAGLPIPPVAEIGRHLKGISQNPRVTDRASESFSNVLRSERVSHADTGLPPI